MHNSRKRSYNDLRPGSAQKKDIIILLFWAVLHLPWSTNGIFPIHRWRHIHVKRGDFFYLLVGTWIYRKDFYTYVAICVNTFLMSQPFYSIFTHKIIFTLLKIRASGRTRTGDHKHRITKWSSQCRLYHTYRSRKLAVSWMGDRSAILF